MEVGFQEAVQIAGDNDKIEHPITNRDNSDENMATNGNKALESFVNSILQDYSGNSRIREIFKCLEDVISIQPHSKPWSDNFNRISLLANNLKGYFRVMDEESILNVLKDFHDDANRWISKLFCLENGLTYFHDIRLKGLVCVCKLALYTKFTKYATDGFTALYTRPPVIYISAAAPLNLAKELRNQLGLPQSSICKVPCNTMFGSPYTMDVAAFDRLLTDDISCGKTPLILIAYAGTPQSGHTDNLIRLREICTQAGIWFHVEGDSLATLALSKPPSSILASASADSVTLDLPEWLAIASLPYCTFYRTSNPDMAENSDLTTKEVTEQLNCFPFWCICQSIGLESIRTIFIHASELAQQMSHRLDMISGVKRLEQSNVVSTVVIFKYKASPSIPYSSSSSLDDEDDDGSTVPNAANRRSLPSNNVMDVPLKLCDAFNRLAGEKLQKASNRLEIQLGSVPREGLCMIFNPLRSARAYATEKDDIDCFVENLEQEIMKMDSTLISRNFFEDAFQSIADVVLVDVTDAPAVGAFQCIPKFWKIRDMSNLSDIKKREANNLNKEMLEKLSQEFSNLTEGKTSNGQIFIQIEVIDDSFDVNQLAERVKLISEQLEDNSRFLETVSDAVQKSIHEAETVLQKESEELFFEDGVLRNVPVLGSFYNWFSPPEKVSRGVTGRAFDLTSGKLESTEKTYKYKMQLQNSEEIETIQGKEEKLQDAGQREPNHQNDQTVEDVTDGSDLSSNRQTDDDSHNEQSELTDGSPIVNDSSEIEQAVKESDV